MEAPVSHVLPVTSNARRCSEGAGDHFSKGVIVSCRHVFLFAEDRSGSTWLQETLDSHPKIGMYGELFNLAARPWQTLQSTKARANPTRLIEYGTRLTHFAFWRLKQVQQKDATIKQVIRQLSALDTPVVGCKVILKQLAGDRLVSFLKTYAEAKYILLRRQDAFGAVLSHFIANATGKWQSTWFSITPGRPFTIDHIKFIEYYRNNQRALQETRQSFSQLGICTFEVTYEALFGTGQKKTLEQLSEFIGISNDYVLSNIERVSPPERARRLVINLDELKQVWRERCTEDNLRTHCP